MLSYKDYPSEYELKNIIWIGIEYDKDKLIQFLRRYEELKLLCKQQNSKEELFIMDEILNSHNIDNLKKLLENDKEYSRWATIERYARKASSEVLIDGKYSKSTFEVISNLPMVDYKLIIKRSKELIKIINDNIAEVEMDTSKIPGVK